jgi:hypothetical protein
MRIKLNITEHSFILKKNKSISFQHIESSRIIKNQGNVYMIDRQRNDKK